MTSFATGVIEMLFLTALCQQMVPVRGFLFPDLKLRPDIRTAGGTTGPRYRIAVLQEEPFLYANGSGYVPDLMRRVSQTYRSQNPNDDLPFEIAPVSSWQQLLSRARTTRGQLAFGLVIPSLELTGWAGRQLQTSIRTVDTTLKLVVLRRKAAEWAATLPASAASATGDVDVVGASPTVAAQRHVRLGDRVKLVVLQGSPIEYLLVRANGYRGPIQVAETAEAAANYILTTNEDAVLLTNSVLADHLATKYASELESVCPSRLAGSGWIYYSFFGRDEAMLNKLNAAVAPLLADDTLVNLYQTYFGTQAVQHCFW